MKNKTTLVIFIVFTAICFNVIAQNRHNELKSKMISSFFNKLDSDNIIKHNEYDTIFISLLSDTTEIRHLYYYIDGKVYPTNDTISRNGVFFLENGHVELNCAWDFTIAHFALTNADCYFGEVYFDKEHANKIPIKKIHYAYPKHLDSLLNYFSDFRLDTDGGLRLRRNYNYKLEYKGLSMRKINEFFGKPNSIDTIHEEGSKAPMITFWYKLGSESKKDSSGYASGTIYGMVLYFKNSKICDHVDYPITGWVNDTQY